MKIFWLKADITRLHIDAIITVANADLAGGGGVDGDIHRAAGADLLAARKRIGSCPAGGARITPGFKLPARYVIHAVGPRWSDGTHGEAALLASAYRISLRQAADKWCRTVAFPAIACGIYGYPVGDATRIAVDTVRSWQAPLPEEAIFVDFDTDVVAALETLIGAPSVNRWGAP